MVLFVPYSGHIGIPVPSNTISSADEAFLLFRFGLNPDAAAMSEFGLKCGIVGSTVRHIATSSHYKQQMQQYEENIAKLQEEVNQHLINLWRDKDKSHSKKQPIIKRH